MDLTLFSVKNRWPWHAAFWILYLAGRAFAYYITVLYYDKQVLFLMLISELVFVGLVYFTLWLYKRLSKLNLILIGIPIWIGFAALLAYSQVYFLGSLPGMEGWTWFDSFMGNVKTYIVTFILLILAKYFKDSYINQWETEQKNKMQLQSELQNLKAQISPHFLFNTMNNFYGLAVKGSDKLPDLMVRLSDLLRYSLYNTTDATVPLASEIAYLENYIALEKIRLEDDLIFDFKVSIETEQDLQIAPLLLIVLVENAFKHSKTLVTNPIEIKMELKVNPQGEMIFDVRNNCLRQETATESKKGIGLENLRKRLEALYPVSEHQLLINQQEEQFQASLKINLKYNKS